MYEPHPSPSSAYVTSNIRLATTLEALGHSPTVVLTPGKVAGKPGDMTLLDVTRRWRERQLEQAIMRLADSASSLRLR